MTNGPESKDGLTLKDARARYRSQPSAGSARLLAEAAPVVSRSQRPVKPVTFNGLLTNKILTALPGEDFARLLPYLEPVSLSSGENIYRDGEEIRHVHFLETAVVSHLYFMEDGSMTAAGIIGREGLVGLSTIFEAGPPSYWTHVAIGGSALRVKPETIKSEFARGGAMQKLLLGYASARLSQLSQRAICSGRHRLEEGLCTWLLMVHDRVLEDQLPLTHEEIAHHLGARRASITTSCNALRDCGAIHYHRGVIRILDRQKLEAVACECYRALVRAMGYPLGRKR